MTHDDKARMASYHSHQAGNWNWVAMNALTTSKAILCMGHARFHRSEAERLSKEAQETPTP